MTGVETVYSRPDTLDPSEVFARLLDLEVGVDSRLLLLGGGTLPVADGGGLTGGREAGKTAGHRLSNSSWDTNKS